jgi:membrane-bound serine protease (ClpP class)
VTLGAARPARVVLLIVLFTALLVATVPASRAQGPRVLLAAVDGAIDRSTVEYVGEAIDEARSGGYDALVIRFDTPGGELQATEDITKLMDNAMTVPILGWVGPTGAHAFSAGTILFESTDLAAMAIGTTIGSVQPVVVGPGGIEPVTDPKIVNVVIGILEGQMALHDRNNTVTIEGRNMTLAEWFVLENLNLNPADAQRYGASNFTANTVDNFLIQADGIRTIYKGITLHVAGAEIVPFSASSRVRLLTILSDPLVASLLLILGIYLVIFGISAPGHGAEIAGVIILLLALVGLGFSVDPIALLLFIVGVVLIIIEVKTPGHGVFGIGGVIAIVLAAAFLAPLRPPRFAVSPDYQLYFLAAFLTPTGFFGAFLLFAMYKVQQVRHRTPIVGTTIGQPATVMDGLKPGEKGYVMFRGELWQALSDEPLPGNARVFVKNVDGIVLQVGSTPPPAPPREHRSLRSWLEVLLRRKAA